MISVPYVPGLSEEVGKTIWCTNVQVIFKGTNTLKSIFMHPKDKIPSHFKQNIVYKWSCPEESFSQSYISESSRCLENRVRLSSHVTSAIYIYCDSPTATLCQHFLHQSNRSRQQTSCQRSQGILPNQDQQPGTQS